MRQPILSGVVGPRDLFLNGNRSVVEDVLCVANYFSHSTKSYLETAYTSLGQDLPDDLACFNNDTSWLTIKTICKVPRFINDFSYTQGRTRKEPQLGHRAALDLCSGDESDVATGRSRAWHHFSRVDHLATVGLG
ncbi:hypothetical protein CSIM01_02622 [Colletotrichum simmondsii]|uniref:Uncharacterized protein n=1 Tax=Colletotrichum simmondsii TaxID=703756 RepID=A0A135RUX7_9PEZI|nr:hypothetical protein CSIM01_02622 [Colletotrichum simmondsii]